MNTAKGTTPKALQRTSNGAGDKSFRVLYYGSAAAGSVPFKWESQPGTPKHALTESSLPPLTPPPSYQMYNSSMQLINHRRSSKRPGFLKNIFLDSSRKRSFETAPAWQETPMSKTEVRWMMKGYGEQEHGGGGSPAATATRCMGGGFRRSYRINKMKKTIQWFVRHAW